MRALPAVAAAAAMLLVGTSSAVSATIADYPVLTGQAVRFAIGAAILLAVAHRVRGPRPSARDLLLLVALAATGLAGFNLFLVEATRHASPAVIGAVVGAVPVAMAIAGPLVERRRPGRRTVAAAVIVTLGTAVAAGLGGAGAAGLALALGALACEVLFSLLAVPLLPRLGPTRVAAYAAALAVPMLLVAGLAVDGTNALRAPTAGEALSYAYLGVVVTAVAFLLWYNALRALGPDRAGLFAGLVPVGSLAATAALGLAPVGGADLAGALLVGAGIVVGMRRPRPVTSAALRAHSAWRPGRAACYGPRMSTNVRWYQRFTLAPGGAGSHER